MAAQKNLHISPNFIYEEEKPFSFPLFCCPKERVSSSFHHNGIKGEKGGRGSSFVSLRKPQQQRPGRKEGRKRKWINMHQRTKVRNSPRLFFHKKCSFRTTVWAGKWLGVIFLSTPPPTSVIYAGESLPTLPGGRETGRSVLGISPSKGAHEERGSKTGLYVLSAFVVIHTHH